MSDPNGARPSRTTRSNQVQRRWRDAGHHRGRRRCGHPAGDRGHAQRRRRRAAVADARAPPAARRSRPNERTCSRSRSPARRTRCWRRSDPVGGLPTAAVVLPPEMTLTMPGAGEVTTEALQDLPGDSMRVGVSNVDGAWNAHYAVIELDRFGVDRGPAGRTVGRSRGRVHRRRARWSDPGRRSFPANRPSRSCSENADDTGARWASVLSSFLAAKPSLSPTDLADTDDPQTAAQVLGAGGAHGRDGAHAGGGRDRS